MFYSTLIDTNNIESDIVTVFK